MYNKLKSNNNLIEVRGCGIAWGIIFCMIWGFCFIWGGRLEIVRRSSWAGTLADFGVGLTHVQGRIIDNVLNKKFVTPPCNEVGLTSSFVGGFSLWRLLGWLGIVSPWEWGHGGMQGVVFHVKL